MTTGLTLSTEMGYSKCVQENRHTVGATHRECSKKRRDSEDHKTGNGPNHIVTRSRLRRRRAWTAISEQFTASLSCPYFDTDKSPAGLGPAGLGSPADVCQNLADKSAANVPLTDQDFVHSSTCSSMGPFPPSATQEPPPSQPKGSSRALPTPESGPHSSANPLIDSTSIGPYGIPITGESQDACGPATQPPDVAVDVSATQIVEVLNGGIWISDKQGNVASGYPQTLSSFWAPNSPGSNHLTDTQVGYLPYFNRWLVTTASLVNLTDGDLYFAISATSDATKQWYEFKSASVCKSTQNGNYPVPDMPILGFNSSTVIIGVSCKASSGAFGQDQLIQLPLSSTGLLNTPAVYSPTQTTSPHCDPPATRSSVDSETALPVICIWPRPKSRPTVRYLT
jgi:hypothetical protein